MLHQLRECMLPAPRHAEGPDTTRTKAFILLHGSVLTRNRSGQIVLRTGEGAAVFPAQGIIRMRSAHALTPRRRGGPFGRELGRSRV